MADLILGPILRYVSDSEATVWVETDARCEVEILGRTARTVHVGGRHYGLVVLRDLEPGSETEYTVSLDGETRWPQPGSPFPAECHPHPAGTRPDPRGVGIVPGCSPTSPALHARRRRASRGHGRRRAPRARAADARAARRAIPAPVAVDRRSGVRRRGLAGDARGDPGQARYPHATGRGGQRRRGVHDAVPRVVGRPAGPLAAVDGPLGDDVRRPRRPRRLEHISGVGRGHARDGLVARADPGRALDVLDLPAHRQPLACRTARRPAVGGSSGRGRRRAAAAPLRRGRRPQPGWRALGILAAARHRAARRSGRTRGTRAAGRPARDDGRRGVDVAGCPAAGRARARPHRGDAPGAARTDTALARGVERGGLRWRLGALGRRARREAPPGARPRALGRVPALVPSPRRRGGGARFRSAGASPGLDRDARRRRASELPGTRHLPRRHER